MIPHMRRFLLLFGALTLTACLNTTAPPNDPSDPATETFASNLHVDIATMQKTTNGVYYRDVVVGSGPALSAPVQVVVTYVVFLKDGVLVDSGNQLPLDLAGQPFGLQEGMLGMQAGGERLIVVPSALGYGNVQVGPIPPNSTLVYDIRLEEIP
jgi:FKBP-type peptidyl-prolyl cis-trans isomerase